LHKEAKASIQFPPSRGKKGDDANLVKLFK